MYAQLVVCTLESSHRYSYWHQCLIKRLINKYFFLFCKALQKENAELREMLNVVHEQLELALSANKVQKQNLDTLNARLAGYIQDLVTVHREITNTLQT